MRGEGGMYPMSGRVKFRASRMSVSRRYGKIFFVDSKLAGGLLCEICVHRALWIVVGKDNNS